MNKYVINDTIWNKISDVMQVCGCYNPESELCSHGHAKNKYCLPVNCPYNIKNK